jgi:pimeloyl-ACP methyl ester carboxylesterase
MPLNMNGLRGRMLRVPSTKSKKRREFLFVYGHHASLERVYGFAEVLRDYGNVTVPDLPGFGGMDSFYKINEVPNLDSMADYLAAFIKLRYRGRRLTLVGFSFGFLVVTRMLQRYPELAAKTDMVVSLAGFARHDDFVFKSARKRMYLWSSWLFEHRVPAFFFRSLALHPTILRVFYKRTHNAKDKFTGLTPEEAAAMTEFEVHLWRCNEIRTYMKTGHEMCTVDNCNAQISLPVWHVGIENDKYFNKQMAEQHIGAIFEKMTSMVATSRKHSPSIIADKKQAGVFFPRKLRTALNK